MSEAKSKVDAGILAALGKVTILAYTVWGLRDDGLEYHAATI